MCRLVIYLDTGACSSALENDLIVSHLLDLSLWVSALTLILDFNGRFEWGCVKVLPLASGSLKSVQTYMEPAYHRTWLVRAKVGR